MQQAALFKTNQSQAVRLPKSENIWDDWFDQPPLTDFPEREVFVQAERESF